MSQTHFFDLAIALIILFSFGSGILILFLLKYKPAIFIPHKKIAFGLLGIFFTIGAVVFYGSFIAPHKLIVRRESYDIVGIKKPIKIALISDIHSGPYQNQQGIQKIVQKILSLQPNLVFLAGDLIENSPESNYKEIFNLDPLRELTQKIQTFAIPGNHEYGLAAGKSTSAHDKSDYLRDTLIKFGSAYLVNDLQLLTVNEQEFYLFGGDEFLTEKSDTKKLDSRLPNIPTLALFHNPGAVPLLVNKKIDLALFGHTHGGQIRLPFFGPLGRVTPSLPLAWYKGWAKYKDLNFFVTSGVGEQGVRARLFNPPEIVLLTIY